MFSDRRSSAKFTLNAHKSPLTTTFAQVALWDLYLESGDKSPSESGFSLKKFWSIFDINLPLAQRTENLGPFSFYFEVFRNTVFTSNEIMLEKPGLLNFPEIIRFEIDL